MEANRRQFLMSMSGGLAVALGYKVGLIAKVLGKTPKVDIPVEWVLDGGDCFAVMKVRTPSVDKLMHWIDGIIGKVNAEAIGHAQPGMLLAEGANVNALLKNSYHKSERLYEATLKCRYRQDGWDRPNWCGLSRLGRAVPGVYGKFTL